MIFANHYGVELVVDLYRKILAKNFFRFPAMNPGSLR